MVVEPVETTRTYNAFGAAPGANPFFLIKKTVISATISLFCALTNSGSTGKPKGVLHDQVSLAESVVRSVYMPDHMGSDVAALIAQFTSADSTFQMTA